MLQHQRLLNRAAQCVARRSSNSFQARAYADKVGDTPYPFTKPARKEQPRKTPGDQGAKAAYPFTKPTEPATVSPPTRPVPRPGPTHDDSRVISREAQDPMDFEKPDYDAAVDYRTSSYSPVPLRVMDGSEETEVTPAAVLSGAPTELQARTVRIYKPAKPATQSGEWHHHRWQMDWDVLGKGHRWENPLMGWQSSGDFMQGTKLNFAKKEDAITFAEKQGYEYFVQEPQERQIKPKAYAEQFLHSYGPLKQVRTK